MKSKIYEYKKEKINSTSKMKSRKQIIFLGLLIMSSFIYSQDSLKTKPKSKTIDLYVSIGSQLGIFHFEGVPEVPFHLHADKKIAGKFFMGLGYSRDVFGKKDASSSDYNNLNIRHNFKMHLYSYFNDEADIFTNYAEGSVGISRWRGNIEFLLPSTMPSIQLFIGFKANITKRIFNQTEFSIGSPYVLQTSFGYKF